MPRRGSEPGATAETLLAEARRLRGVAEGLRARPSSDVVDTLGAVGERFLRHDDPLRLEALERLPNSAGLSAPMARVVLDGMAADWTRERIGRAVRYDFPEPGVLDGFRKVGGRMVHAVGAELTVQIVAGGVPGVGVNALMRALLVKSPTLLRQGRGDDVLSELFVRGLAELAGWLSSAVHLTTWPSDDDTCTEAALRHARAITVYGSDATVSGVRAVAPPVARLIEYHHRVAVVVVGRDGLEPDRLPGVVEAVARSVSVFEQRGCVCPHWVVVESGGTVDPEGFGSMLAEAMARVAEEWPTGSLEPAESGALQQLRGVSEMQVASHGGRIWHGGTAAPWTVVYEPEGREGPPTLARGVRIRPWTDLTDMNRILAPFGPHLQTVGVAGLGDRRASVANELARLGATRIVDPGAMAFPPAWWLHDGRRPLDQLVRWVELEGV